MRTENVKLDNKVSFAINFYGPGHVEPSLCFQIVRNSTRQSS